MFKRLLAYHADLIRALVAINAVVVVAGIYTVDSDVLATGFAALQFVFIWLGKVAYNRDLDQLRAEAEAANDNAWAEVAAVLGAQEDVVYEPGEPAEIPEAPLPPGFALPEEPEEAYDEDYRA